MRKNWTIKKLGELCSITSSRRIYKDEYVEEGISFYRGKEIINLSKNEAIKEPIFISLERYNELKGKYGIPEVGDILLISIGATLGIPLLIKTKKEFYFKDGNVTWFKDYSNEIYSQYIYNWLRSDYGNRVLWSSIIGSAQPALTIDAIKRISIEFPPYEIQRKIASILSAYDDLIENNTRRIKILEEMAQRICREWFVKFRFPGHEKVKMVESELGMIPEGWKIKKLSQLVDTQYGYTESASEEEIGPKFVRGTDINKTSYIQWDSVPYCPIQPDKYTQYELSLGDILVIRMADPGKVGIIEKDVEAVFASYLIRFHIKSSSLLPYYLFYFLLSERYQNYATGASTGTTRKSASAGVLTDIDIVLPLKDFLENFEGQISAIRRMLNNLLEKNANLRQTRDLLLPKLISGQVDVSELDVGITGEPNG